MLTNLIEGAKDAGCDIVGVLRYERTVMPDWRLALDDFFKSSPDYTIIKKYKIPEIKCKSANSKEFTIELLKKNVDVLLVGTWGERLKKEIIDVPVIASVNVHPSFLPKYRGPNPYLQTILHGEKYSGITFHLMDGNYDRGAILAQKQISILPNDTSKELKQRTVHQARSMCSELLKKLETGMVIPVNQNENEMSYYPHVTQMDMMLDFVKENSKQIDARIRALHPWLPCYLTYEDKFFIPNPYKLKILETDYTKFLMDKKPKKHFLPGEIIYTDYKNDSITVLCNDKRSIQMDEVKLYGKNSATKNFIKKIKI